MNIIPWKNFREVAKALNILPKYYDRKIKT